MNETLENLNMLKIEISIGKFWKPFNNISLHNPTEAEKKNKKKNFLENFFHAHERSAVNHKYSSKHLKLFLSIFIPKI